MPEWFNQHLGCRIWKLLVTDEWGVVLSQEETKLCLYGLSKRKKRTITLLILVVEGCWAGFAKKMFENSESMDGRKYRESQKPCKANPIGQGEHNKQPQLAKTTISNIISSKTESMEGTNKWDSIFVPQSLTVERNIFLRPPLPPFQCWEWILDKQKQAESFSKLIHQHWNGGERGEVQRLLRRFCFCKTQDENNSENYRRNAIPLIPPFYGRYFLDASLSKQWAATDTHTDWHTHTHTWDCLGLPFAFPDIFVRPWTPKLSTALWLHVLTKASLQTFLSRTDHTKVLLNLCCHQ